MSLPTWLLKRRGASRDTDVIVVGAGLSGLVCAAVLARAGKRVVVVDRARRPGGRLKTAQFQGYAVDLGPVVWEAPDLPESLQLAGVADTALADIDVRTQLRVAATDDQGQLGKVVPLPVPGAVPSPATLDAVRSLYGIPPRVFAGMGDQYTALSSLGDEEIAAERDTQLGEWIRREEIEKPVANALLRSAVLLGSQDPEAASVAALERRVRVLGADPVHRLVSFGDAPIAGAQGVIGALVDSVLEAGGELRLGTQAVGLALEEDRCVGLAVCREEQPFLEAIESTSVVMAMPRYDCLDLLPGEAREFLQSSAGGNLGHSLGVAWGIEAADAQAHEDAPVVLDAVPGAGDVAAAAGERLSLFRASALAPRVAPPGRALVLGRAALPTAGVRDAAAIEATGERLRGALELMLPGAGSLIEWEHHWVVAEDGADPLLAGTLPETVPGLAGVRLANAEVRLPGMPSTGSGAAARAGRLAAERILAQ
jgi:phytoene dehydrogenase-like protein